MATPPKRGTPGSADNLEAMLGALKSVEKNVSFVREKLQTLVGQFITTKTFIVNDLIHYIFNRKQKIDYKKKVCG